ncbi:Rieske 2Fe-2S domain-containing protein [Granulicella arctica]|uniref:Vanillate O-demethylase monooxygenase subunit n=1 Tax=Granulicella arctica TaxID=940613 RepID=A0A7Y9THS0_9BACT|nr:aromatic ring-hydroxylating dioxygenase subunit alpha [Granulicella arctica]NYF80859.1 vanillate O-demethylase monooxygenase subunit [Granulicella arctica]
MKLARHWYPVALSREVTDGPVATKLLDELLVIYRVDGKVVVANDLCPHRGVPLSKGKHDGQGIACAYHGLRFGAEGRCNKVPAQPDAAIPPKLHLRTYPTREHYGLIWTCLRPDLTTIGADIPSMPHWDDPGFQQITCPPIDIFGFAGRQIEGFLDVAHFGFVHADTFGDSNNTVVPPYRPIATKKGFEVEYRSSVGNYPIGATERGSSGFEWLRHFRVHLPFTATLVVHFPNEGRLSIMNAASPVSAKVTRLFAPIARNYDTDLPVQDVYDFNLRVFEEDKAIVESQKPECLPLDSRMEAHILADRSSIAYRRGLRDMGLSRFFIA